MKSTIKYLIATVLLFNIACVVDMEEGALLYYRNDSHHQITITEKGLETSETSEIVLMPGEKVRFNDFRNWTKNKKTSYEKALYYAKICRIAASSVTYDDEYRITNEQLSDNRKITDIMNYDVTPGRSIWRFTYTFTDEDYEYAKEHGENLYE